MLAGLQTVPDQLLRAARVDGAARGSASGTSPCRISRGVSLVTVLLLLVTNLNSFTIPWIMTGGGPAARRRSDHAGVPARLRPHPLRPRLGVLGHSVRGDHGDGLVYVRALTRGEDRSPG